MLSGFWQILVGIYVQPSHVREKYTSRFAGILHLFCRLKPQTIAARWGTKKIATKPLTWDCPSSIPKIILHNYAVIRASRFCPPADRKFRHVGRVGLSANSQLELWSRELPGPVVLQDTTKPKSNHTQILNGTGLFNPKFIVK